MITIALVVTIIGLALYATEWHPKVTEAGRIAFFAGLLALLMNIGARPLV